MPYNIQTNISAVESSETFIEDISFVSPSGFHLTIDNIKFKNAQFLIQTMSLPDISAEGANLATPMRNISISPDKITYSPFECTFLIDEKLINYKEIHDWILAQIVESDSDTKKTRDMTLSILDSNNNVARQIQFVDAYPTNLSSIPFDTTATDIDYLVASVSFNYSYYKII